MTFEVIFKTRVVDKGYTEGIPSNQLEKGCYHRISHMSTSTKTKMIFGLFLPSSYSMDTNTPVLFWLSGLACDDTNFAMKAGSRAFDAAEQHGMAIVMPDTSPRHDESIPNVDEYDFGIGAGFYINATVEPYSTHFQMYDYVTQELPSLLQNDLAIGKDGLKAICGHSMGGHGALTIALREGKTSWRSVSAFAPICHPTACHWGQKAFQGYLGSVEAGKAHDATCLMESLEKSSGDTGNQKLLFEELLIDLGTADEFLHKGQLLPDALVSAAEKSGQKLIMNMREGFDHSYYFIAKFIEDHVHFHAKYLV
mmetsp:Transcript_4792/g.9145  ORF Transcript_4792/g.9145 Transcript_4792/m.9145 type:complete len:310 (+) Transcript_4792:104-1033(+)